MDQTFESVRVHAVIVYKKTSAEKLNPDPKEICITKCGKTLLFANAVQNVNGLTKCKVCLNASKSQLSIPEWYEIVYLHE